MDLAPGQLCDPEERSALYRRVLFRVGKFNSGEKNRLFPAGGA